ncbi:hypothetical protein ASC75_01345 [Aminobacter sp. DSM 101952]|nr:DUF1127 domain-containing protein [Aminobacter sp. DSM 101952]KQU76295.1 hypothetical protein ASC75_01345 [Aminobacter sp. DSM 101952]
MSALAIRSPAVAFVLSQGARIRLVIEAYLARRAHHRALRNLSELDDYLLKDIGVARCEIDSLAYGSSERKRGHEHDMG